MCISSHISEDDSSHAYKHTHAHTHNLLKHDNKVDFVPAGFSFTAQHNAASLPTPTPAQTHNHAQLLIGYYLGCRSLCWYLMKGHGCHFSADGHQGNRSVGGKGGTGEGGFVGGLLQGVRNKGASSVQNQIWFSCFQSLFRNANKPFSSSTPERTKVVVEHIYWKGLSILTPVQLVVIRDDPEVWMSPVSARRSVQCLKKHWAPAFISNCVRFQIDKWSEVEGRQKEACVYIIKTHMFWNSLDAGW